jgi:hypothetical protein
VPLDPDLNFSARAPSNDILQIFLRALNKAVCVDSTVALVVINVASNKASLPVVRDARNGSVLRRKRYIEEQIAY